MSLSPSYPQKYFFGTTNNLHADIVSLHDFVLPTATALWNFREIMEKEFSDNRLVTASELAEKYNRAPGTRGSTNLVVPFRTHTWEMQRERLAEVALVNVIALFEMWCDEVCEIFRKPELSIKLQYPSNSTATSGIRFALRELQACGSSIVANSIQPALRASRKYDLNNIDNLLKCYRYFKEIRNCLMHRGAKV